MVVLLLGSVSAFNINEDLNTETVSRHGITITAPYDVVCDWRDPGSDYKICEVVFEVNNTNPVDFPLTGLKIPFKHAVKKNEVNVSHSTDYLLYTEPVLNITCYNNLSHEERLRSHENESRCYYNVTRKVFFNWIPGRQEKIPAETVVAVKLVFESPILVEDGRYLKNQFNFSLVGVDKEVELDPDISACSTLSTAGATYNLTADITNANIGWAMHVCVLLSIT
jgi:hypothetical protein